MPVKKKREHCPPLSSDPPYRAMAMFLEDKISRQGVVFFGNKAGRNASGSRNKRAMAEIREYGTVSSIRLSETLPEFFAEARESLSKSGHGELARQMEQMTIKSWTHDPTVSAMYLYLSAGSLLNTLGQDIVGVRHGECVSLDDLAGIVVVDVDSFGGIMGIEIIGWPNLAAALERVVPSSD